jgi:2-dehydro-3-deoxyphosphogluconate aldolase / (4S)-4-hydroxy-2-oxoglutarate aldolase
MLRSAPEGSQGIRPRQPAKPDQVAIAEAQMTILERGPVLGIIRYRSPGDVRAAIDAVLAGGVPLVEVTIDTPGALEAVAKVASDGIAIGVGTVLTAEQVRACADVGASFVVAPSFSSGMVEAALTAEVEPIPGVLTPTELLAARRAGAEAVKVFPAAPAGGPALIRALRGPFPDVPLLPTGGIEPEHVPAFLEAGATCVGLGATLVGSSPPTGRDVDAIRDRAVNVMQGLRP